MKIFSAQLKGTTIVVEGATASITGSFTGSVAGIDINATNTFTASTIARLNSIETISSSNDGRVNSLELFTSSTSARLSSIETISASNLSRLGSLEAKTGSLASTGSNTFIGTQTITGSLYISSDLIVQGSSSLQNITASAVSIGTNLINLNTANPAIRYAGLVIGDSGSVGGSGSFLYDSVQDEMLFIHRGGSSVITSSVALMGPETYDNLGNETYLTGNRIPKSSGNEHLIDSNISDDGNIVRIQNTTLAITGSRVGINTSFPTQALEVSGSITTNNTLYISKAPSDTIQQGPSVYLVGGSGASYTQLQQGVDRFIIFGFNGSSWVERLTINNTNGRVGIGITNPEYSLDVNGAARFGSNTYKILSISDAGGAGWATTGGASTSPQLYMFNTGTNAIVQTYINNTARLEVSNSGISVTGASTFGSSTTNGDVTIISNGGPFQIKGRTIYDRTFLALTWDINPDAGIMVGNTLKFNVNPTWGTNSGTTAMTILANGKVGIGETSPDNSYQGLTIKGTDPSLRLKTTNASGWVWTEYVNSSGTNNFSMGVNQTTPYFGIKAGAGLDNPNFAMISNGNVGIGTASPGYKLDVYTSSATSAIRINSDLNQNSQLRLEEAGTVKFAITYVPGDASLRMYSAGSGSDLLNFKGNNVGIGVTNPGYKLTVDGSTRINRSIYNWYQAGWQGNSTYWHMKTNMNAGAGGNIQYTMSLFKGYFYSYSDPSVREGAIGFHNWSGTMYQVATQGNLFTTVYRSSDDFVVLVIPSGAGESAVTIDWHQAYAYPFVQATVTAAGLHGSTTGKY